MNDWSMGEVRLIERARPRYDSPEEVFEHEYDRLVKALTIIAGVRPGHGRLLFDPRSPDTVYALTWKQTKSASETGWGVYRSADGGATWQDITGELAGDMSPWVVLEFAGGTLYARSTSGLYKWVPGGK